MDNNKNKRVVIAMSGGVDSSVAAFLLKKEGYEVIGMFMRLIKGHEKAQAAARAVCQKLGIKFYPINIASKFQDEIIDYFVDSYKQGITPNPCVKCNRLIKFGELFSMAKKLGAEYFATGHYIIKHRVNKAEHKGLLKLFRGNDQNKDQSYFLYNLNQEILARVLFPLGEYQKEDIRKIADKEKLPYLISESQDVCFLNQSGKIIEHNEYLKKYINNNPGKIKTLDKVVVGEHKGLPFYTPGQRKGIEIGGNGPYYAAKFDYKNNILYVAKDKEDKALYDNQLKAKDVNWISGTGPLFPFDCEAVIRYRHKPVKSTVDKGRDAYIVKFKEPQRAITPGQSVVFYRGDELIGGGVIL